MPWTLWYQGQIEQGDRLEVASGLALAANVEDASEVCIALAKVSIDRDLTSAMKPTPHQLPALVVWTWLSQLLGGRLMPTAKSPIRKAIAARS